MRERNGQREVENLKILKALLCLDVSAGSFSPDIPMQSSKQHCCPRASYPQYPHSVHPSCEFQPSDPMVVWSTGKHPVDVGSDLHQRCAHISPRWMCLHRCCGWHSAERAPAACRQQWEESGWNGSVGQGWRNVLCCLQGWELGAPCSPSMCGLHSEPTRRTACVPTCHLACARVSHAANVVLAANCNVVHFA